MFKKIYRFIRHDVWLRTDAELSKGKKILYMVLKTIVLSIRGYAEDELNTRAKALTYSMVFSVVPVLAMVLAIAKGFGFEQIIEDKLNNIAFLEQTNAIPAIMGFVERYLATTQGGLFLGIGIIVLLWAVYAFFRNIELSFNRIWNVKKSRNYVRQFTAYITILLMIPMLVVVTSGFSIFLHSTLAQYSLFESMPDFKEFCIKFIPFLLCWIIFSLMYNIIPNTKVKFAASVIPGIVIGTLFQLLQMLSVNIVIFLSRTNIVYGTFAAIPLILMWLYWSCLLTLIGAEMSYAIQNNEYFEYDTEMQNMSRRYRDFITLYLTYAVVQQFEEGLLPQSAYQLAKRTALPIRLVNDMTAQLVEVGILRETYIEENIDKTYMPAMDIHKLTVAVLMERIDRQGTEDFIKNIPTEMEAVWQNWKRFKENNSDLNISNLLVKDLPVMKENND